jgi:hypothetical protein
MLMQEHHDLADDLLVRPSCGDLGRTHGANACDITQALRRSFYNIEHILAEGFHQPIGIDRPNAPDHPRAKVFFDALDGRGSGGLQKVSLELQAVVAIVQPHSGGRDPFAGGDHRGMTNRGD